MPLTALDAVVARLRRAAADAPSDRYLLARFAAGDHAAFATLVYRHGGRVLATCRQVLADPAEVDDAFQATFLVLVAKARSVRWQASVGGWLAVVAHRVAVRARDAARRRKRHEGRAAEYSPTAADAADLSWREACGILHDELDRLPDHLRLPLVLCYLHGLSRDEAATQLGWSAGSVKGRLERGRVQLRRRLERRGVGLSAGLLTVLAGEARTAVVPPALSRTAAGLAAGGVPSAAVVALAAAGRATVAGPAALAGGLAVVGLIVVMVTGGRGTATPEQPVAKPQAAQAVPPVVGEAESFTGRVVGPDGRPVAGAKVYKAPWWGYHFEPFTAGESATTGPDGRFSFTIPKDKLTDAALVTAASPGLGVGWVGLLRADKRTDLTLHLVADDVLITGQIMDLEGKPVAGATVRVVQIMASPKENLGPWLDAAKDKTAPPRGRDLEIEQEYLPRYATAPCITATTDAAGRFRLTGAGRERLVFVQLDGPTIMSEHLRIITRPAKSFTVPSIEADPNYGQPRVDSTYYGADFRHAAGPTKPVVGVIRDRDSKMPLAGVTVRSEKLANNPLHGRNFIQTKTDGQGRYRLVGLPKGAGNKMSLVPAADQPYVSPTVEVPDSLGLAPVAVDVELKRAVRIEGRLTDQATGRPIRGHVSYVVRDGNPHQKDYNGFFGGIQSGTRANDDGTFRLIGLPGPGELLVFHEKGYLLGAERDDVDGLHEEFGHTPQGNFAAFAHIDPPKGAESVKRDVAFVKGWTFTGTVVGPDGQPAVGTKPIGLYGKPDEVMKEAAFTVRDYNPRRPRPVVFHLPEKNLVGIMRPPAKDGEHVTVRMQAAAAVTGRLVDANGEPRPGVELRLSYRPKAEPYWDTEVLDETVKTDGEGRFRVTALVTDMTYHLSTDKGDHRVRKPLRLGETTDIGDVTIRQ